MELHVLTDIQVLKIQSLSETKLHGTIPTEFGMLTNLITIGFAGNMLTGPIPNSFKELRKLQVMNVVLNYLSGTIPSDGFTEITSLEMLALSSNSLTGTLPEFRCFQHFFLSLLLESLFVGMLPKGVCQYARSLQIGLQRGQFQVHELWRKLGKLTF